jgi:1-aminocyclopropane-1-carboxylate deaminase/D-cysteine desulfhydrase-like pyridoxal-dependent ACC family enzyme
MKRKPKRPTPSVSRRVFLKAGIATAGLLAIGGGSHYAVDRFNAIGTYVPARLRSLRAGATTHLFDRYPGLANRLPWRSLTDLGLPGALGVPGTPIETLPHVEGARDVQLYVKRDDRTSDLYGGNKVRKLEHLLAAAELDGRRTLVTIGAIGTHHGLATALHGRRLGLATKVALFDSPVTPFVENNVRGLVAAGAELRFSRTEVGAALAARDLFARAATAGGAPAFLMVGGSSRLGSLGYVNAGLELAAQVAAGLMPEPDRIFVAVGSCGTAAGLVVGCRLAGLRTRVTAVRVSTALVGNRAAVAYLANDLAGWLHENDPTVPRIRVWPGDVDVVTDQFGRGYGHGTDAGAEAAAWAAPRLAVEPTYTAKTLAACVAHCRGRARPGEVVLYWHTLNAADFPAAAALDGIPARLQQRLAEA